MAKQSEARGIKAMRNNPDAEKVKCGNCGCERFGKCGCKKRKNKN